MDEDSVDTPVTSNSTIDMSTIDFDIPAKKEKVVIPQSALKSKSKFCEFLFEEEKSIPSIITDSVQQLNSTGHNINTLDGNNSYTAVINQIKVMDNELGDNNNGDSDIDWYGVVDISAVRLRNNFIQEGFSNSDIVHEEYFDSISLVEANTIDLKDYILDTNSTTVPNIMDKFCFMMIPELKWMVVLNVLLLILLIYFIILLGLICIILL